MRVQGQSRFGWVCAVAVMAMTPFAVAAQATTEPRQQQAITKHIVVAAHRDAADAGRAILRKGGSAVDAAIAVQLVLSLVEPQSSGIGGGAFMMVSVPGADGQRSITSYDGRETAPNGVKPTLFAHLPRSRDGFLDAVAGGHSVGTPGVLAMLAEAHKIHGKLPWRDLFDDAIRLSEQGFIISPRLQYLAETDPLLRKFPAARDYLFTADGKAKAAGTRLKNPEYAAVLKTVRDHGVRAFYEGPLAQAMADAVQTSAINPGALSVDDLASYSVRERAAICGPYRVYTVCSMAPPSSGGTTVLGILGVLENFDLANLDPNGAEAAHLFAEASRLAYADRDLYVGDPDFVTVPTDGLIAPAYLQKRAALIDATRSMGVAKPGHPEGAGDLAMGFTPDLPSTSHFVVLDDDGLAISMTTTVESAFGSRLLVNGYFLNNQMTDFAFQPEVDGKAVANSVAPGKRPRSSMAPAFVFDQAGALRMAIGSPGGPAIIDFVARAITGFIDWKLDAQRAVELPHVLNSNGPTTLEDGTAVAAQADALRAMGHQVTVRRIASGLNGFVIVGDGLDRHIVGGADPRREGVATGD